MKKWKKKWDDTLQEKNFIKINNIERKPICNSNDIKKTIVNSGTNTDGRVNFITGNGKRKKYLNTIINWKQKNLDLL